MFDQMKLRIEKAALVKDQGGNKYQQLEARLMDYKTGKLIQDPVICAMQTLNKREDVLDFYIGYFENVKNNLEKYHLKSEYEAKKFVLDDVKEALNLHFYEKKTHRLWNPILKSQLKK